MENNLVKMTTLELRTAPPFSTLFPIREKILGEIAADMKKNGYDHAHPVTLWAGHKATVIDGHTRLQAALKIGLTSIPVVLKEFPNEDAALRYAIKSQSNRRNLTDAELLNCIAELDQRKREGRPSKTTPSGIVSGTSSKQTADLLGVSQRKIERLRAVQDHASDEIKDAITSGEMSVNRAYNETMRQRRKADGEAAPDDKVARLAALVKSIGGMIGNRIDREIRDFPEIGYSDEEKEQLKQQISAVVARHIDTLPNEEKRHYGNA